MMRIKYLILCAVLLTAVAGLLLTATGCARHGDMPPGTVKEIRGPGFEGVGVTDLQQAKPGSGMGSKATGSAIPAGTAGSTTTRPAANSRSPIIESEIVTVQPLVEPPPSPDYIVGPYDVLYVNVNGKPEFSRGPTSGSSSSSTTGCLVDGSGNIQLPYVGAVHVWGMTPLEIQTRLMAIYPKYFNDPWVIVDVREFKSHPFYILGQFKTSGIFYMDRPLNLLQGIAMGSGYDATANPRAARVIRDRKILPVDVYELLMNADQTQNIWLKPGDTIFMPDNKNRVVFVFGAGKTGGPIPMPPEGLSLLRAIAIAGLQEIGYHSSRVFVLRSFSPTRGQLMVVDVDKIIRGDAMPMALAEGDIIYIPKSAMTTWNEAISEILPSLRAFGAILQPFVQVKYLENAYK